MTHPPLSDFFATNYADLLTDLLPRTVLHNCAGSADSFAVASLFNAGRPVLAVVGDHKSAERMRREIAMLIGEDAVALFPSRDAVPYNMKSPFGPVTEQRLRVLARLLNGEKIVVVTPSASLLQKTLPPRELFSRIIRLTQGDDVSPDRLAKWLSENGFVRETMVETPGQFAIRGGIVDIYPFIAENPFRLEYWGDTIETIREFDIYKQKSLKRINTIEIFPMKEFVFDTDTVNYALNEMENWTTEQKLGDGVFSKLRHAWKSVNDCEGAEWFFAWFEFAVASLLDYCTADTVVFWNDVFDMDRRLDEDVANYERHIGRVPAVFEPYITHPDKLLFPPTDVQAKLATFATCFTGGSPEQGTALVLPFTAQPVFGGSLPLIRKDLDDKIATGFAVQVVCETTGHADRLLEQLEDSALTVHTSVGILEHGFIDAYRKIAVYSETQAFNRPRHAQPPPKKGRNSAAVASFDSLSPGDFVVHADHGIARFRGIERIEASGATQDCMVLLYQENSKVYVPVSDFEKVQKYIGKDSDAPSLSRLGTGVWDRQKEKTREAVREMAQSLVVLYAKRQYLQGIAFPVDTPWQREFDEAFIYEPTPDQRSAMKDIAHDMESSRPMDRLVCGDVGFGKTEVAMRAAFKAASSGYQVAVLAPTTILAAQHVTNFAERMADFPVRIAGMSRFNSPKEQKENLVKITSGEVDIIIGTHRILSQDIKFKNLGLLIIDEEQRFGVGHKERLKELRYSVDVLSLSATPIPRTLHMSLAGIRDLSIINTPPRNRLPVETQVLEYRDDILKMAVESELERGGQIYVVNNRIKDLYVLQDTIEQLVPAARCIVAHGQMDEGELENIMKAFVAGRYDVLLATTIIENGLDISNVNTIVVNQAQMMGLSQLYQLRGRVGRSSEQAFAYFLVPSFRELSEISTRRLKALEQYTDLGSGFQIAMRDLELRGAGNLLGFDQSGDIAAVGFDMYNRILKEEIDALMGQSEEVPLSVSVDLPLAAYIPGEFIPDAETRIAVYQEVAALDTPEGVTETERSFVDRFGAMPESVVNLLMLIRMKLFARKLRISKIGLTEGSTLLLTIAGGEEDVKGRIKDIFERSERDFEIVYGKDGDVALKTRLASAGAVPRAQEVLAILVGMQAKA